MANDTKADVPPRRRRVRALSDEELKLWRVVTRDAKPLPGKHHPPEPEKAEDFGLVLPSVSKTKQNKLIHSVSVTLKPVKPAGPPPLAGLDRRTSQKLARGQVEAEARLDLHGHGREEARIALLRFVSSCRASGLRCVLVITGKGESPFSRHILHSSRYHEAAEHSGILRSALPVWLEGAAFRAEVASFQPAHPKHGGGGAFYLWLRKRK
ncbi:DNA mismatch repair protein MutS [Parvibaculum sedimenti]|uniref:DNA mismatch repair protein MutS n=1 Tax=Parvibaculum sedimenti TaxID=2608632 RepID=A0A6N6VF51_9HYPH|nr:Smr/MutS family protein [Parvibaculum sedimenti]KAB7738484.1 DNA mismatch repair protein MutS [Parvibaculum sedimenti]